MPAWPADHAAVLLNPEWTPVNGALPGTVRRLDMLELDDSTGLLSSHGFGMAEALALGRALEDLPDGAALKVVTSGVVLELAEDVVLERPVELHFRTDAKADGAEIALHHHVRAGRGARATVIEFYDGAAGAGVVNEPLTEIECAENSEIRHWKVIREHAEARHLGTTRVRQAAHSRYESREFGFGGAEVRRDLHVDLAGRGAECDLTSLAMAGTGQRMDNRTHVDHRSEGCMTHELYKGIYAGQARGSFDGLIHVHRDAQQTAAHQTNRNLLLSDDATVRSIPRLEIYADDVKCSHGSTTGQLDGEQVFFLRSRGFDAAAARVMLARAFGAEIVEGVDSPALRSVLNQEIARRLADVEWVEESR